MSARCLMIQGTGSDVGKSVLAAGLCRVFAQDGYRVAPFKAQNMSLNSFVTRQGGEMGRAQVVQAEAAFLEPHVDMNPILLKPSGHQGSQVILHGRPLDHFTAREYYRQKSRLWQEVTASLDRLRAEYDIVVIEGAGSPAEINLKASDIVNMRVALHAQCPVLLVGDIDRGGVFAWLVGTLDLLPEEEQELIQGLVINKFRGDVSLLTPGLDFLEERTGKRVLGVLPYVRDLRIEDEDSVALDSPRDGGHLPASDRLDIAVIRLPRISNFTDFHALTAMDGVGVRYVSRREDLGSPDVIILPGTKNTLADLTALRERGLSEAIKVHVQKGVHVVGICGGFQILGREVRDPLRVESLLGAVEGLGLLDVVTTMHPEKTTQQARGRVLPTERFFGFSGELAGYEIHQGETEYLDGAVPLLEIMERSGEHAQIMDGAISGDGKIWGTYLHGLFDNDGFRVAFVNALRQNKGLPSIPGSIGFQFELAKQQEYDRLAAHVREHLDIAAIYEIVEG